VSPCQVRDGVKDDLGTSTDPLSQKYNHFIIVQLEKDVCSWLA